MIERLEQELQNWLKRLQVFLEDIRQGRNIELQIKHPTKDRLRVISRRELMKKLMRSKLKDGQTSRDV